MRKLITISAVVALVAVLNVTAQADLVLNFDDVTTGSWATISNGYGGFDWTNSEVVVEGYAGYYVQSAVSDNYAFDNANGLASTVSKSSGTFDFLGAHFTPANGLQPGSVIVEAFTGSNSKGTQTVVLTDAVPQWVDFTFTGIDKLVFTPVPASGHGSYFAMDNFTTVPVPGAFLLGILGLGVANSKLRRRRTA